MKYDEPTGQVLLAGPHRHRLLSMFSTDIMWCGDLTELQDVVELVNLAE
jgi:hypothetical protein